MKRLVLGSIVFFSILCMITPSVPAIEFSVVRHVNEVYYENELLNEFGMASSSNDMSDAIESFHSSSLFTSLMEKMTDVLSAKRITPSDNNPNTDPQPQGLIILGFLFYGIILYIIFKIVLFIFQDISAIVFNFLYKLTSPLRALLNGLASLLVFMFSTLLKILTGTIQLAGQGVVFLVQIIVFIVFGLGKVIQVGWHALGTCLLLILQIFQLIFHTIFPANSTMIQN